MEVSADFRPISDHCAIFFQVSGGGGGRGGGGGGGGGRGGVEGGGRGKERRQGLLLEKGQIKFRKNLELEKDHLTVI